MESCREKSTCIERNSNGDRGIKFELPCAKMTGEYKTADFAPGSLHSSTGSGPYSWWTYPLAACSQLTSDENRSSRKKRRGCLSCVPFNSTKQGECPVAELHVAPSRLWMPMVEISLPWIWIKDISISCTTMSRQIKHCPYHNSSS